MITLTFAVRLSAGHSLTAGSPLARYFCHFISGGERLEDGRGFSASSHPEAIEVARAIAVVMMADDESSADAIVLLQSADGEQILHSTVRALATPLQ